MPGGDRNALLLCVPVQHVAELKLFEGPILRWAREWWLATSKRGPRRPEDVLTVLEIVQAHRLRDGVVLEGPYREWSKDPVSAVAAAVQTLGWQWKSAAVFINRAGQELHCGHGTPAMLKAYVAFDFRKVLQERAAAKRQAQGEGFEWGVVGRLFRSRAAAAMGNDEKRALARWGAGNVPTKAKLAR